MSSEQSKVEPESYEPITGALIGRLVGLDPRGRLLVDHPANPSGAALPAASNVALGPEDIGAPLTLLFEAGDPLRPIILAKIWQRAGESSPRKLAIAVDGEQLTIEGEREIVLRCGKASLTLTRAGKILLHGTYISQTSTGMTKIRGASVHIN